MELFKKSEMTEEIEKRHMASDGIVYCLDITVDLLCKKPERMRAFLEKQDIEDKNCLAPKAEQVINALKAGFKSKNWRKTEDIIDDLFRAHTAHCSADGFDGCVTMMDHGIKVHMDIHRVYY